MGTLSVNPSLYADLRFDPVKDFQPITPIISFPHILIVPGDSPAKSVAELAALAKSKPGGLSFGSQGVGSGGQILGEMFKATVGAPMVHVPYRGAAPAVTDVMARAGSISCSPPTSRPASRRRAEKSASSPSPEKAHRRRADVPTMAEAGFPGLDLECGTAWWRPRARRRRS